MANLRQVDQSSQPLAVPSSDADSMLQSVRVYPAFRLLLLGTLATNSAFWMYQVAVGWLALQMTDSPFFVGLTGFTGGIPLLLLSLPAGVIIDRFDRRSVLLVAQFGVMVVAALFAILVGSGVIEPWSMLMLAAAYGTVMSFIFPTRTAIVPSLIQRRDLANAIALNAAAQNATRVVGPSLAGILIAALGVSETFAIAALMQILALFATSRLPPRASESSVRGGSVWSSLTLGLRIVAKDPFLIALITMAAIPTVLVMPYINLMPVFARDVLGLGSSGLGMLLASTGLGTVAGALSVARSPRLRSRSGAQVIMAAAFAILILVFAITPVFSVAVLLLFAAGWMSASFLAINQTALQMSVDDHVRGRVLSIYLLTWGMLPLGQLAVGAVADQIGTPLAMVCACSLALGCIGVIAWRFPSLRG
ncbi:MAG TPA: MFS transporter [Thermomicrobiales bacterium]|nr:MFS transporter [Thermomicrobiales bacterium]